jgi:hypothetical protein
MTETEASSVRLTDRVPQEGGALTMVGTVTHYYSHIEVAAVRLVDSRIVKISDVLQFGETDGRHIRIRVVSMERQYCRITSASGPDHVGIETGCRVAVGDPVYLVA